MSATPEQVDRGLLSALAIAYSAIGVHDRAARLADAAAHVGRPLTTTAELTTDEARALRRHLPRCSAETCRSTTAVRLPLSEPPVEPPAEEQQDDEVVEDAAAAVAAFMYGQDEEPGDKCYGIARAVLTAIAVRSSADAETLRTRIEALADEYERRAALNADPTSLDSRVHQMAAARLRAALDAR